MWLQLLACSREPEPAHKKPDPDVAVLQHAGARPVQRMNRYELDRALRELTGVEEDFVVRFPPDEVAYGFDNQAEALSVTAAHLESLESVVDELAAELLVDGDETTDTLEVQGEGPGVTYTGEGREVSGAYLLTDGAISASIPLEDDGSFLLSVFAAGTGDADGMPILEISVDNTVVHTAEVTSRAYVETKLPIELDLGLHTVSVRLANPSDPGPTARSLGIDRIVLVGPTDPQVGRSAAWRKVVPCAVEGDPDAACADRVMREFGERAWRRPLTEDDLAWAHSLETLALDAGAPNDEALVTSLRGILLAPEFLYRPEAPPAEGEADRALDGYEVATRLAAFLWSSLPDEELLRAARDGELDDEAGVREQVRRMLAHPNAVALVDDLGGQWFDLRDLSLVAPDPVVFPDFDEALRASMEAELRQMSTAFFLEEYDFRWLVENDESFIDERLAEHYGVAAPSSGAEWTPTGRVGITGTAAFLATHARPARASAVSRGKWVMANLLCDVPPPPPPSVDQTLSFDELVGSVREQEEAMRSSDMCQGCHAVMDPIGWSMHGFDAVGATRTEDELGFPVDTETEWNGAAIRDQADMAALVANDPRLHRCAVEQTMTYALGRPVGEDDEQVLASVTDEFVKNGSTFGALAEAITVSAPFRRRGHLAENGGAE